MNIITRPIFVAGLILTFILAGFLGGPGSGAEPALMHVLAKMRADLPAMTQAAAMLTQIGSAPITLSIAGLAALSLLLRRAPGLALLLAVTVLGERSLVDGLKQWIGRPRPPLDPALIHSLAYPSGHSANSMTAFLATALIACPAAYRAKAAWTALALAVLVGFTRVWLGVHWPSDVIGGWAFGLLAVATALTVASRSDTLREEAQHNIVGRHGSALGKGDVA